MIASRRPSVRSTRSGVSRAPLPRKLRVPGEYLANIQRVPIYKGRVEATVRTTKDTVIQPNTKINALATKSCVLTIFGVTGGLALLPSSDICSSGPGSG